MQQNSDNLQLASLKSRAMAFVIDDLVVTCIVLIIYWDSILLASNSADSQLLFQLIQVDLLTPLISLKVIYHTFFVWYYGATVGKIATKIKVIDFHHWGKVSLFSSFLRAVGRIFSEMFFYIGFAIAFFNEGRRSFHDYSGKTLVVNV